MECTMGTYFSDGMHNIPSFVCDGIFNIYTKSDYAQYFIFLL